MQIKCINAEDNRIWTSLCVLGMLLELPAAVLSQMLQDEAMLTTAVEKALRALQLEPKSRYKQSGGEQSTDVCGVFFYADEF